MAVADLLLKKTIGCKEETGFTEESTKNPIVFQPPSQAFPGDPVSVVSEALKFPILGGGGCLWLLFKLLTQRPTVTYGVEDMNHGSESHFIDENTEVQVVPTGGQIGPRSLGAQMEPSHSGVAPIQDLGVGHSTETLPGSSVVCTEPFCILDTVGAGVRVWEPLRTRKVKLISQCAPLPRSSTQDGVSPSQTSSL